MAAVVWLVLLHASLFAQPKTELTEDTVRGFEEYVASLEKEFFTALGRGKRADWIAQMNVRERARVRNGEIVIRRYDDVPKLDNGIIHDWAGVMFVPDVKADAVVELLMDYDRHSEIYDEVVDSKLLKKTDDYRKGFLRFRKKQVLTVILNTEHEAGSFRVMKTLGMSTPTVSGLRRLWMLESLMSENCLWAKTAVSCGDSMLTGGSSSKMMESLLSAIPFLYQEIFRGAWVGSWVPSWKNSHGTVLKPHWRAFVKNSHKGCDARFLQRRRSI